MKLTFFLSILFCIITKFSYSQFYDTVFLIKHNLSLSFDLRRSDLINICGNSDSYYYTKRYFRLFYSKEQYKKDQNPLLNNNKHKKNNVRKEVRKLGKKRFCYFKNEYSGVYIYFHKKNISHIQIYNTENIRLSSGIEIGDSISTVSKKLKIDINLLEKNNFSCYDGLELIFDNKKLLQKIVLWNKNNTNWRNKYKIPD